VLRPERQNLGASNRVFRARTATLIAGFREIFKRASVVQSGLDGTHGESRAPEIVGAMTAPEEALPPFEATKTQRTSLVNRVSAAAEFKLGELEDRVLPPWLVRDLGFRVRPLEFHIRAQLSCQSRLSASFSS
jgi:hypothetical protein